MWSPRNTIAFVLLIVGLVLFYFGITEPMLHLTADGSLNAVNLAKVNSSILDRAHSIIQTISDLYKKNNGLTAFLILLFSVVIPLFKSFSLFSIYFTKNHKFKKRIFKFVHLISKWSMADVFVVAIFIAYMSTRNQLKETVHQISAMGFNIPLKVSLSMDSFLGPGFYYFAAYCLLSMCTFYLIKIED